MTDFHSHILPDFDDGAKTPEISEKMLAQSYDYGVRNIVSTSHCYPRSYESVENFLLRREKSYQILCDSLSKEKNIPKIHLGCEVNMTTDLSELHNISKLCIEDTNYILVEMPHDSWKDWMVDSVYKLTLQNLRPIMAHIDRYLLHNQELLKSLFELDVIYQVNAELFIDRRMKKLADRLVEYGCVHLIGSDMHNLTSRKPNLNKAKEAIINRYGEKCFKQICENSKAVLNNEEIPHPFLTVQKKKGFFGNFLR